MDIVTYALAKKMASSVASGITEVQTDGANIRFKTANNEWFSVSLNSVSNATVSATGHLIIELTDGTTIDAGVLPVGPMDTALSTTSENGVQNKVVTVALNGKQNILTAGTGVTIDTTDPANPEISANVDYTNLINKPTKLSDFTNDQDFIDNTVDNLTNYYLKTETYTQTEVDTLIGQLTSLSVEIVEELPTENISTTTIYLVNVAGTTNYAQWMYINNAWSNIGNTSVDLSNYYTKGQADTLLDSKVDKVLGKGLSTNDFNNTYKDILDNYTVDSVLDSSSTNPIQNGTVTDALNTKQPKTLSSPITVGGVSSTTVEGTLGNLNALVDTKLTMVTSLPASPSNGDAVLYIGTSTGGLKAGGIYQYQVSEWVLISYAESFTFSSSDFDVDSTTNEVSLLPVRRVFHGTTTEWDALTTEEKIQYGATAFTDDDGGEVVNIVEAGNMSPVTSNAVAEAVAPVNERPTTIHATMVNQTIGADVRCYPKSFKIQLYLGGGFDSNGKICSFTLPENMIFRVGGWGTAFTGVARNPDSGNTTPVIVFMNIVNNVATLTVGDVPSGYTEIRVLNVTLFSISFN